MTGLTGALAAVESAFVRVAQRKALAVAIAGLLPLLARALLLPLLPPPKPAIQDEFSYLLASDTFASGRLTNPTPAWPEHFETPQVLIRPSYASKYPPLSGLVMALAQKLTGQPWLGVWLSMGVLCSVICWALQGWLPAVWALTGSLIGALHIGIVSYWTESYWGGTCAAIGGALLAGALPRLMAHPEAPAAAAYAAGLAVLANSRPFEGFFFAAVCTGWLAFRWVRVKVNPGGLLKRALLPMALIVIPAAAWMGYYNFRVTGHALEMPYVAHDRQYALEPPLLLPPVFWQNRPQPAPVYSNAFLREFWQADRDNKEEAHHQLLAHFGDFLLVVRFFIGWPLMFCALLVAGALWRDPVARPALALGVAGYIGPALDTRVWPHYAAAGAVLAYIVAACVLRALRNAWPGVEGAYLMWGALIAFAVPLSVGLLSPGNRCVPGSAAYLDARHAGLEERLNKQPGDHLVLVHYGPQTMDAVRHHRNYQELVYNHADIDRSKVIWARSLGVEQDAELLRRYPDRQVWMVEEDSGVTLTRYPGAATQLTMAH